MSGVDNFCFQLANPEGSWLRRFQDWWQRWVLVIPPIFMNGRGMFQYTAGTMPHRRPITVVVGAPVKVRIIAAKAIAVSFDPHSSKNQPHFLSKSLQFTKCISIVFLKVAYFLGGTGARSDSRGSRQGPHGVSSGAQDSL